MLVDDELVATLEQVYERDRAVNAGDLDRAVDSSIRKRVEEGTRSSSEDVTSEELDLRPQRGEAM